MTSREALVDHKLKHPADPPHESTILSLDGVGVTFHSRRADVVALENVSLSLRKGAILAVVGESGSGKSVMTRAILGLLPRNATREGRIYFDGTELTALSESALCGIRGSKIGLVLQDPLRSLDPTMKIGKQIGETLRLHNALNRRAAERIACDLLGEVRIKNPEQAMGAYPHQFSGGMRQRAAIAMALACEPALLIADEPTTALDVSTQTEIMDLLRRLQVDRSLSVLFISHDLGLASDLADEVLVMYGGRVMERLPASRLADRRVPYTRDLLDATPTLAVEAHSLLPVIPGQALSRRGAVVGCVFADRCRDRIDICSESSPVSVVSEDRTHETRCWNTISSPGADSAQVSEKEA